MFVLLPVEQDEAAAIAGVLSLHHSWCNLNSTRIITKKFHEQILALNRDVFLSVYFSYKSTSFKASVCFFFLFVFLKKIPTINNLCWNNNTFHKNNNIISMQEIFFINKREMRQHVNGRYDETLIKIYNPCLVKNNGKYKLHKLLRLLLMLILSKVETSKENTMNNTGKCVE